MKTHKIAVIAGDGIGKEVMPEGVRVLDAAARKFGIELTFDHFDWSCDYYDEARLVDAARLALDRSRGHDCIFFGAVGWPAKVPDHVSLWGSLILFRRGFDQYVNLRPVRLMPGISSPLAGRKPGDIDFYVVRENTEGEYSAVGGRAVRGHRARDGDAAVDLHAQGRGPHHEIRLRARHATAAQACHLGDQVQRHLDHHAVLGRALRGHGEELPAGEDQPVPHRHPDHPFRAAIRTASTSSSPRTCSATSSPTSARPQPARSASRRRATSIPRATFPVAVRAGARLGAGHRRQGTSPIRSARSGRAR